MCSQTRSQPFNSYAQRVAIYVYYVLISISGSRLWNTSILKVRPISEPHLIHLATLTSAPITPIPIMRDENIDLHLHLPQPSLG